MNDAAVSSPANPPTSAMGKLCPNRKSKTPFAEPWEMLSWGQWGPGPRGTPGDNPYRSPARVALPAEHPIHCQFRARSNLNYNYTYKYTDYNYLCYK